MPQQLPPLRNGATSQRIAQGLGKGRGKGAGRWLGGTVPRPPSAIRLLASALLLALLALITAVSLQPGTGAAPLFPHIDKLEHFAAYFAVAALALPACRNAFLAFAFAALWGAGVELLQGTVATDRDASLLDAAANTAGALAGVWASRSLLRRLLP